MSPRMGNFEDPRAVYVDRVNFKLAMTGSLPNDPPLLEELGISLPLIRAESQLPLRVLRKSAGPVCNTSDLTGPILILVLFTALLVLHGKLHFGYIYLISLTSASLVYVLLNLIATKDTSIVICCSILGYSLGPVLLYSLMHIGLRWTSVYVRVAVGLGMAFWSAYTASIVFCQYLELSNRTYVVGFPLLLTYVCFVLMVLF